MPGWNADSNGKLNIVWTSLDDFLSWINATVAPSALQYGYKIVLEPVPKEETAVDRA